MEEATDRFAFQRQMLMELIDQLDLHDITLLVQDWGGLPGLSLPVERQNQITQLLLMNAMLETGQSTSCGFDQWPGQCFISLMEQDPVVGRPVMFTLRRTVSTCLVPLENPQKRIFLAGMGWTSGRSLGIKDML